MMPSSSNFDPPRCYGTPGSLIRPGWLSIEPRSIQTANEVTGEKARLQTIFAARGDRAVQLMAVIVSTPGGSWMVPRKALAARDWATIGELSLACAQFVSLR